MPLYAYRCKACDNVFEKHQRMTDEPWKQCPVCAGEVRRMISNVGVVFKGAGFYITDNRNGNGNGAVKQKDDKKDEGKKAATKSETAEKSATTTTATTKNSAGAATD
jgi:putative FmdB family regulatory protein